MYIRCILVITCLYSDREIGGEDPLSSTQKSEEDESKGVELTPSSAVDISNSMGSDSVSWS